MRLAFGAFFDPFVSKHPFLKSHYKRVDFCVVCKLLLTEMREWTDVIWPFSAQSKRKAKRMKGESERKKRIRKCLCATDG